MLRVIGLALVALVGPACGLVGPSCLGRQERGAVTTISGEVAAGALAVHRVPYETAGSQNDARISWAGQSVVSGPRISVHATRVGCTEFTPPPAANSGPCAVLGSAGALDGAIVAILTVANGRGNPDVLGSPAEYKLWVVGDAGQSARYEIAITWFYGPDC
jgi:hypothetical protein